MEVFNAFGDQLKENFKGAPGWFPLIIVCLVAVQLVGHYTPSLAGFLREYGAVIGLVLAGVLYFSGDALDEAVFPRKKNGRHTGWRWLAPPDLEQRQKTAEEALSLDEDYYAVSKSLAEAAGKYGGSWIKFKNEFAKFVRSAVLPAALLGLLILLVMLLKMLLRGEWMSYAVAGLAFIVFSGALLWLYGRLKGGHMCDLYVVTKELTKDENYGFCDLSNVGIRLFFWKGKLVSSGRLAQPKRADIGAGCLQ
jgi:hypothetical protein